MRPRYLVAVAHARAGEGEAARLAVATGLDIVHDSHPLIALANPACRCLAMAGQGLVLGTLFHRHGPARPIEAADRLDRARLLAGRGDTLLGSCWGGYVAAFAGGAVQILRDPSGALPCYYAATPVATLFASDIELLLTSGLVWPTIDRSGLARQLWRGNLPTSQTVLDGIIELLPGFAVEVADGSGEQCPLWSPWDYVNTADAERADIAERLRRTVSQCVLAWTAKRERLLVSVSGGLDSAIVAACLVRAGRDVECLTLYGDEPSADERVYARALCAHVEVPLVERRYAVEAIDLEVPLAAHLPRPIGRSHEQAYERAHLALAREIGADAFVTGNGGDNVFGYSQSAGAIADRLRSEGLSAGVLRTLGDVCRQTGCGPAQALGATLRLLRRRSYRWRAAPMFLEPSVQSALAQEGLTHPWLDQPGDAWPGKAGHVAALLRVQQVLEPGRSRHAYVLHPLLSQPIVEACLAIPSWEWRAGGIDRAMARRAFAPDLPETIAWRRTKGGPDAFCAQVVDHHRATIRERLLDGRLAAFGLLDRGAVEAALRNGRATTSDENVRILDLVDTEAWLDTWIARLAALKGQGTRAAHA